MFDPKIVIAFVFFIIGVICIFLPNNNHPYSKELDLGDYVRIIVGTANVLVSLLIYFKYF